MEIQKVQSFFYQPRALRDTFWQFIRFMTIMRATLHTREVGSMTKSILYKTILLISLTCIPTYASMAQADSAAKLVGSLQSAFINIMKSAKHTPVRERYDKLVPVISTHFHIPLMTQIVIGKHWSRAEPNDKAAAISAFQRINVATLATIFDGYSGETFVIDSVRRRSKTLTIVFTHLVKSDKSKVKLAYVAGKFNGGWRLIDVVVDGGISELKVRRSEYNLVLLKSGLSGLIQLLNEKANELMAH